MSTINVKVVKVEILDHPGADRLDIARIGGYGGYTTGLCFTREHSESSKGT
jgi:hypothetical protein